MKCFKEVHQKLIEGWALTAVAKWIQEDRNESVDIGRDSLVTMLQRYRDSIPPGQLAQKIPEVIHAAVEKLEEGLDELKELEDLYRIQKARIAIDFGHEKKLNKLMATTGQEVRVAREILTSIADLKMDLGVNTRHLGQVDAEVKVDVEEVKDSYAKDSIRKVLASPESRQKVLSIAQRFLNLPDRIDKAVDPNAPEEKLTPDEDLALLELQEDEVFAEGES